MIHLNKYSVRLGKKLQKDEAFVLVSEEFGYRYWFWFPEVSQKELIRLWQRQERIDKFNFINVLPGKFILAGGANVEWSVREDLFYFLYGNRITWIADIFDDCDSLLITSFPRRYICHKGRHQANLMFMRDIEEQKQANFDLTMRMMENDPNFYGQENPLEFK
jgi:hypothetical protein